MVKKAALYIPLLSAAVLIWWPVWFLTMGILLSPDEVNLLYAAIHTKEGFVRWCLLPSWPSLRALIQLLFDTPEFFVVFWNSCLQCFLQAAGQLLTGLPAAWAMAQLKFPGRRLLFGMYVVLMLLPFQVTMVPEYLVLSKLGLLDTSLAIILPGMFAAFPVFIMTRGFEQIPKSMVEAARLDGAGEWAVLRHVGIPMGRAGVISAVVLGFLEAWGAVERPMSFLENPIHWPFTLYLPQVVMDNLGISMAAGFVAAVPAVLLFMWGQKYLQEGIMQGAVKE